MKHTVPITLLLILLFFLAEGVGLYTVNRYLDIGYDEEGNAIVSHPDTLIGEQPEIPDDEKGLNFIPIMIAILLGTALLFVIIHFRLGGVWKIWFMLAITVSLALSFDVYMNSIIAAGLAFIVASVRIYRPNMIVHNLSEVFVYTGITILILPWLNLFAAVFLLIVISIYDMIAVWKSKHMIKLANFQIESKLFAGLAMSYKRPEDKAAPSSDAKPSNAILGGGDIAFPLIFSAAVMESLILKGAGRFEALGLAFVVTVFAGIALTLLLFLSERGKFYPAMPFISAGCFLGYGAMLLLI